LGQEVHSTPNIFITKGSGSTWPKQDTESRQEREKLKLLKLQKLWAPKWARYPTKIHQAAASLPSLPLPGILTSAHINEIDYHRNRENHTQHTSKRKGKLV